MSNQELHTAQNIISYVILGLGFFFSGFTVIIILANWHSMIRNTYSKLMFIIQFLNFWMCLGGLPSFAQNAHSESLTQVSWQCKAAGIIFYLFFLASCLFMEMMLLLIYADLSNKRRVFKKYQKFITIGILIFSIVIAVIPINQYKQCLIGDFPLYCGQCSLQGNGAILWVLYILPVALGIVLLIMLFSAKWKLEANVSRSEYTSNQNLALNSLFIPLSSLILLGINFGSIVYTKQPNPISQQNEMLWIILNQLIFLIPIIDFFFFRWFVSKMEDIAGVKILYCRKLFGLKSAHRTDEPFLDY